MVFGGLVAQAVRAVWSEGEVHLAIRELSDTDVHRLLLIARGLIRGVGLDPKELLGEAITKLLDGSRKVPRSEKLMPVLVNAMRGIVWNERKLHDNARVDSGNDEALNSVANEQPTPEELLRRKNLRAAVLEDFAGDDVAQAICEGWFFEDMSEKDLCDLTGLDATRLASKKRAITRKLIRSGVGAHLR